LPASRHDLPAPFHVLATQNPLEQEGTTLSRSPAGTVSCCQIDVLYPDREAERRHAVRDHRRDRSSGGAGLDPAGVRSIQQLVRRMPVASLLVEAILNLVRSARPDNAGAKLAAADRLGSGSTGEPGADACVPRSRPHRRAVMHPPSNDVIALAEPVAPAPHGLSLLRHVRTGLTVRDVVAELKAKIS